MYVCICNAVTEDQVRVAIDNGADSVKELREKLMVTGCCGSCLDTVKGCIKQYKTVEAA
jgi:bacterioferritin-associated ferredoxin